MPDTHDLFFSYRTKEAGLAQPLLDALTAEGVDIWRDTARTDAGDSITPAVRRGLSRSRTLLAFYTEAYNDSRVCQWELTTAWSAARAAGEPTDRVFLVLPPGYENPAHVHAAGQPSRDPRDHRPEFDAIGFRCPPEGATAEDWRALAQKLKARLAAVDNRTLGQLADLERPTFHLHHPDRSNRFVGRLEDLWRLDGLLHAGRHAIITGHADSAAQVLGMGGIGKTQLATEYAWRFASAWPGGVVWVTDVSRERDDVLFDLAPSLDPAFGDLSRDARIASARRHLQDQPYLWVLDNVPATLDVNTLRQRSAPTARGVTLLTTRSRAFHALGLTHDLDVLPLRDALDLLTKDRPAGPEQADAEALCREVGFHPLALDVLRGLVAQESHPRPFARWRERLRAPDQDALALADVLLADEQLPGGYARSIAVVLQSSLEGLTEAGWEVLRVASQLAELPIPLALVEALLADVSGRSAEAVADERAAGVNAAVARSLAKRVGNDLVVHTLVVRVVRRMEVHPDRAQAIREAVPRALLGLLQGVLDIRTHAGLAGLVEHARLETVGDLDAPRARLAGQLGIHDRVRGDTRASRALYERALDAQTRLLGEEHPDTLTTLQNLAVTLQAQGDLPGARRLFERALDAMTRLLGEEHPHTLGTLQNLALTLKAQGDIPSARRLEERALDAMTRLLGEEHPQTLGILQNLALTLKAQGDIPSARRLEERALDAMTRLLGEEHPDTLNTLQNLANTLADQGDLPGAQRLQERALDAKTRLLGEEHPNTLNTLQNLAGTLQAQGDLPGARRLFERALDARTRLLGEEHPDTLNTLQNLAGTLQAQGDLPGARRLFERALDARTRLLGEEHPDTLNTLQNLAGTLRAQGDLPGARRLFEHALDARTRLLGEEHPDTLTTLQNLAVTIKAQGGLPGARRLLERALDARTRLLGEEHPDTLTTLQNLAGTLQAQGDLPDARRLFERALDARTRLLGEEHPDTLNTLQNLAVTLDAQGDLPGARRLFERALDAKTRLLGEEHPDTRVTRFNLVLTLLQTNDGAAARAHVDALGALEAQPEETLAATDRQIRQHLPALRAAVAGWPSVGHKSTSSDAG